MYRIMRWTRTPSVRHLQCRRAPVLSRSGPLLRVSPQRRSYASVEEAQDEPHEVAPEEEDEGKPTVCIIGAGIAGCSVGHVLKNKGVPCEIFEKHLQDSIIKTKRQPRLQYDYKDMAGFAKYLDSTADEVHAVIHAGREPFVKSNFFIRLLQSALPIHFGLHLMEDATFQPQKPFKPSIPGEQIVKRQRSSFVVAADGTFSCVRWQQEAKRKKFYQYRFPAVVYSCTVVIPFEEYLKHVRPHLRHQTFANLSKGSALLHLCVVRVYLETHENGEPTGRRYAHMRMSYSRTASSEGYAAFYEHAINQIRNPPSHYEHDKTVLREIHAQFGDFGQLDPPFDAILYHALTGASVNRKIIVDSVRTARQDLLTHLDVGDGSAPCVLLGDAAYSVPVAHDYRSPTQVVSDGVLLGEMIADAWRNPEALRQVPAKFYEKMYPIWRSREQEWLDLWQKLHNGSALPEPTWISVNERANTPEPTEDELEFVRDDDERGDFLKHFREKEAQRRSIMAARTVGLGEGGLFARYGRKKPVDHEKQRRKKGAKLQHGFELVFSDLFLCEEVKLYDGQSEFFQKWLASRESPNVEEELAATSQDNEPQAARTTEIP